ncbi:hypothetical protein [Microcoleus sp. MON2_D5]
MALYPNRCTSSSDMRKRVGNLFHVKPIASSWGMASRCVCSTRSIDLRSN